MKKHLLTSASVIALALGGAAQAADLSSPGPSPEFFTPAPVYGWEGFYVGAHAGGGRADLSVSGGDSTAFDNVTDQDGFLFGVHAGYNWVRGNVVYGVEADLVRPNWVEERDHIADTDGFRGKTDFLGSIRGRLGHVVSDDLLIYGTGGIAFVDSLQTVHYASTNSKAEVQHNLGGVVGAGLEYRVSERMTMRAEGLYYFFGDESFYGGSNTEGDGTMGLNTLVGRVGASFYLGEVGAASDHRALYSPMPASAWQGFYAGVHAGGGQADVTVSADADSTAFDNVTGQDGFLFGAHAGYNWRRGNVVYGIEADMDWPHRWESEVVEDETDDFRGDVDFLASIRGRVGHVVSDNMLLYGTGGLAFVDSEQTIHYGSQSSKTLVSHELGGVVGAGLEYRVSERMTMRAEGLYYFFGDESFAGDSAGSGTVGLNVLVGRVGASVHFN